MTEGLKIIIILFGNLFAYWTLGELVSRCAHVTYSVPEKEIAGFFLYFALFQVVALPLIMGQFSVSLLVSLWEVVLVILFPLGIWFLSGKKAREKKCFSKADILPLLLVIAIIGLQIYYMARNGYNGWDTAYYIGTMNTSMKTDTMYIFNGNDGTKEAVLDLRYALCGFYMHGVVWCRLLKLHVLLYSRYVTAILLSCLSNLVLFEMGKTIFGTEELRKTLMFVFFADLLHFSFVSTYSTSEFLLTRSAEAKGYCANVILPAIFWIALRLQQEVDAAKYWILLLLLAVGCNGISFSSVLLVPVLLTIVVLAIFIVKRKSGIWIRYAAVMAVPSIYAMVYFLFSKNLLVIGVK